MSADLGKRPRGRPRSIDRTAALEDATRTFWRLGYDGASLGDLTAAMGLSRPTLYATYGDKAELFVSAVDHYGATVGLPPLTAFQAEPDIEKATAAFLTLSAQSNTWPGMPSGCLIACCAATAAETNPALRDKLAAMTAQATGLLADRFAAELASGRLAPDPAPTVRAALLVDFRNAQAIRARTGATLDELLADLHDRVRAVLCGIGR